MCRGVHVRASAHTCYSPCNLSVISVRTQKPHKYLCILWPSSVRNIKHCESFLSHSASRPSLFPEGDDRLLSFLSRCSPALCVLLIIFHLCTPHSLHMCVYSGSFHFSLRELASFYGPGKTTKGNFDTRWFSSLPIYSNTLPLFLLVVLNSSPSISLELLSIPLQSAFFIPF